MKRSFTVISSICIFYSSVCTATPASMDWVKSYVESKLPGTTYELFQHTQGGVIYYLDSSKKHGLVAAMSDIASQQQWWVNDAGIYVGAILVELFQGFQNTTLIINSQGTNAPAASSCSNYSSPYSGWYLPSIQELNQMYFLMTEIGGFDTTAAYWSSSESTTQQSQAMVQVFAAGGQNQFSANKTSFASIRCIRAF